ncbi:unnamed protein product [Owenia fusiformis]|uniref:Uncharacterized protein n=1 Tax=Owenia fusiformis TaxID=6347 RepID=A0A8J1UGE4_OWEFU|nr:unnamed protein product [Owenia fusiformis]
MFAILLLAAAVSAAPHAPVPALYEPNNQIVNGEIARQHEFPFQISLKRQGLFGSSHSCGAVMIDSTWIMSAAHCTQGGRQELELVAGAHRRNREDVTGAEQVRTVSQLVNHPGFRNDGSQGFPDDICLMRVNQPFSIDGRTAAVIPRASGSTDFAGQSCTISGWGDTTAGDGVPADALRKTTLPVLSQTECAAFWSQVNFARHICIFDVSGNTGSCQGDSGGPMRCSEGGQNVVAGVTSWGVVGCTGMPNVYTRVASYNSWICQTTGNAVQGC